MSFRKPNIILIVDDSKIWLEKLTLILQDIPGVETILLASSYEEAIPLLSANPDFVFLDIHMPGKNGIELLHFIKTNFSKPKICMVSNSVNMMSEDTWKSLEVDAYFDKSNEFQKIPEFIIYNQI